MDQPSIRRPPRATAIDPVCGMTVDPATSPHRHDYRASSLLLLLRPAAASKFAADPEKYLEAPGRRAGTPMRGRRDLHLPDASAKSGRSGRALARSAAWRSSRSPSTADAGESRTRRHDAAVLDWARFGAAGLRAGNGRPFRSPRRLADARMSITGFQFALATPVVLWAGWPFFVRGWAVVRHPQPQHVHPDRRRAPASPSLTASSRRWRRNCFPPAFRGHEGGSRAFISKPRR